MKHIEPRESTPLLSPPSIVSSPRSSPAPATLVSAKALIDFS